MRKGNPSERSQSLSFIHMDFRFAVRHQPPGLFVQQLYKLPVVQPEMIGNLHVKKDFYDGTGFEKTKIVQPQGRIDPEGLLCHGLFETQRFGVACDHRIHMDDRAAAQLFFQVPFDGVHRVMYVQKVCASTSACTEIMIRPGP